MKISISMIMSITISITFTHNPDTININITNSITSIITIIQLHHQCHYHYDNKVSINIG